MVHRRLNHRSLKRKVERGDDYLSPLSFVLDAGGRASRDDIPNFNLSTAKIVSKLVFKNPTTWINKWSTLSTNMMGQTASLSIAGPASNDNYTGPIQIQVYKDNVLRAEPGDGEHRKHAARRRIPAVEQRAARIAGQQDEVCRLSDGSLFGSPRRRRSHCVVSAGGEIGALR